MHSFMARLSALVLWRVVLGRSLVASQGRQQSEPQVHEGIRPHNAGRLRSSEADLLTNAQASEASAPSSNVSEALTPELASKLGWFKNLQGWLGYGDQATQSSQNLRTALKKSNQSNSDGGRVFFLFLTKSGIEDMDLWRVFFEGADPSRYQVFMHCKEYGMCSMKNHGTQPFEVTLVDSVPTKYCEDLVTGMVQLLRGAVQVSTSPNDKFVFLSESALPVKPFDMIHETLTSNQDSDICVAPTDYWVQMKGGFGFGKHALLVKHSQWVVLNTEHAWKMVNKWPQTKIGDSFSVSVRSSSNSSGMNMKPVRGQVSGDGLPCTDEWSIFATLFGVILDEGQQGIPMKGFGDGTLWLRPPHGRLLDAPAQGVCRTFAVWHTDHSTMEGGRLAAELLKYYPSTKLSCLPKCEGTHPATFTRISDVGVSALRRSRFLFARKFGKNVMSIDQFTRIILSR